MIRSGVREYFRLRGRGERLTEQVDEEIAFHLEQRVQRLMEAGWNEEDARAEAQRRFGPNGRARLVLQRSANRREHRMSVREWLMSWRQDVSYSARSLAREPLVALVVIVTLALGIGANATMFGIIDQLLVRGPAHIAVPDRVGRLYMTQRIGNVAQTFNYTSYVAYTQLRDQAKQIDGAAAYLYRPGRLGSGPDAREIRLGASTHDMFGLLGVTPRLGRFFTGAEDRLPKGERVAVIDYTLWKSDYGRSRSVIGKTITVDDDIYTIIGVAPEGFTGPELKPVSLWIPISTLDPPHPMWPTTWSAMWLQVITRAKPGVSAEAVGQEATRLIRASADADHKEIAESSLSILPLRFGNKGEELAEIAVARWLVGVAALVLLIACANVLNLLLSRAVRRRREVSIRLAMGISRARLMRLLLTESLVLALIGGIAAMLIAYWGGQFIRASLLPDVQWNSPVNQRVLIFSALISIAVALLVGLVPALQSSQQDLAATLKAGTRQGGGGRRSVLRESLTVLQAALSVILLIGAGLFIRSMSSIDKLDLGIETKRVLAVWPNLPGKWPTNMQEQQARTARDNAFNRAALARVSAHPGVESAALAVGTPLEGGLGIPLAVPGRDSIPEMPGGGPYITAATPEYFATVGTSIVRGRGFVKGEGKGTPAVTVISEFMARTLWPGEDALTKCLIIGFDDKICSRVIGIAENAHRTGLRDQPSMQYYVPLGQEQGISGAQLIVRPRADVASFIPVLRDELFAVAPDAKYFTIDYLQNTIDKQARPWRLGATLFGVFGALALLIAAIGMFSVVGYGVAQRRTELGIRMALGARSQGIALLIMRQGILLSVVGIVIGLLVALAAGRFLEPLLFDTSSRDPRTMLLVAGVLLSTAVAACLVPAARAGRVDPVEALKAE